MTYFLRRLITFPLIMLGVSILVFVAIRLIPGDSITAMLGTESGLLTPDQRAALAQYFGIDQNWLVQYGRWIWGVLQGDFGLSITYGKPVLEVIAQRFPLTLELAVLSLAIALIIGMPAGIYAATRQDKLSDLIVRMVAMIGQSTPNFVIGLVVLYILSALFGISPTMGRYIGLREDPIGNLTQLGLPALILGFSFAASVARISRSSMLDVLNEDYVRTARAKGVKRGSVIWKHALRNALIPVVTLSGVEFGYLLGGAVIVEQIFALPGLGRVVLEAIGQRDYAMVQGSILFIALNFLVVNLLVDLLYVALDPRIRLETR
ncbi:dipeptide ABC transporter [Ketogulonicigenium robustum]|uniref:Dipeptide ABC transporter n=1 Tax=Ketogulonicigenium robustum TaxID=92947 RepID=A0A1W6NXH5_9RHOB|nr:ABC transporter permease [Ketogulonicigenium robustum]ARO13889.1 dipeptide ABC transporter [Ketogulonicigenium robustum]